jgi:hypothetical protein
MTGSGIVPEQLAGRPFQPEVLLPAQQPPRRPTPPEEVLAAAVLADAVRCVRKYRRNGSQGGLRLFRETEQWFLSKRDDWPFAFGTSLRLPQTRP